MNWVRELGRRLLMLLRRGRFDADLADEMRLHRELREQEQVERGLSHEEARYTVQSRFGNDLLLREESRDMWGWTWLEQLVQDARYGLRMLAKNPGFTVVAVFTLALGIGANTAIFSVINAVMIKMLPVKNPEELVLLNWIAESPPGIMPAAAVIHSIQGNFTQDASGRITCTSFAYPTFEQIRARKDVFSKAFAFADSDAMNVVVEGQAQLAEAELISGDYFGGLGVEPTAGRAITEADDRAGAAPVAVISYGYWERRFGRAESVVGRAVTINNIPFTIVGVSPPEFFGLQPGRSIDVWVPLHTQPLVEPSWTLQGRSKFIRGDDWWVVVAGRLKLGVTERQATSVLGMAFQQSITAQLEVGKNDRATAGSRDNKPPGGVPIGAGVPVPAPKPPAGAPTAGPQSIPRPELSSASKGLDYLRKEFSKPLFILMGVVGLVLLTACANVANLLLARAEARRKEVAVRLAIGAGRVRLIRQLLVESVMLAALGGAAGLLLAHWATRVLVAFFSSGRYPISLDVRLDLQVLVFAVAISTATGVLFGMAPAFRSTQVDLPRALKETGSFLGLSHGQLKLGLGKALVISQVAVSILLLVGAGLFVRTLQNLERLNLGFNRQNVLLFGIDPTQKGYKGERLLNLYQELQSRLEALPGVRSASASQHTLIGGGISINGIVIQGKTLNGPGLGGQAPVHANNVGPRFFETMGIPIILGRPIRPEDTAGAPKVGVINETLARRYFESANPLGRRFGLGDVKSSGDFEVVGVAADAKYADVRKEVPPTVYVAYRQNPDHLRAMHFEVKTAGDPEAMIAAVRRAVQDTVSNVPLFDLKTQAQQIDTTIFQERLFARLSGFFGLLGLTLTCLGLYGMMAYAITRRTNEIGIRVALGADRRAILRMVMREAINLIATGIVIGVPAALAAGRLTSHLLFGLTASDPITIAAALLIMSATAVLAGYLPARRATKVDPMVALRYE